MDISDNLLPFFPGFFDAAEKEIKTVHFAAAIAYNAAEIIHRDPELKRNGGIQIALWRDKPQFRLSAFVSIGAQAPLLIKTDSRNRNLNIPHPDLVIIPSNHRFARGKLLKIRIDFPASFV